MEALFAWGPEEEKSFKDLRQALCESPILQYPDFEKPTTVTTDASDYAIESVLSKKKGWNGSPCGIQGYSISST